MIQRRWMWNDNHEHDHGTSLLSEAQRAKVETKITPLEGEHDRIGNRALRRMHISDRLVHIIWIHT